jgi:hypothetical protein
VPWSTVEAANQVKGRHEFNRYVLETALKLVKASQAEKHRIFKSTSMLDYYIRIGR